MTSRSIIVRSIAAFCGLLLLLLPLASCGTPAPLQFTTIDLGIPAEALASPQVGPLPDATKLSVRITFKIDPKLLQQSDTTKGQAGQKSNLEQLASKIGISDATYQKIKDFFNPVGVSLKLSKLRTHLAIDAKASTFAKLLQTKFVIHNYNGRKFYAPATPPKLPTFLANSIDAITGLDNYSVPPTHALADAAAQLRASSTAKGVQGTQAKSTPQQDCSPLQNTLLPRDVAHAYGYDQLWQRGWNGEGMTVNLVEIDGFDANDINNYLSCINFKGHVSTKNIDGAPSQALGEATLDVQMVAGLARSINIVAYQTDGNTNGDVWAQVNDMLQAIIDDNTNNAGSGNVVSISLGSAERDMAPEDVRAIDSSLKQLTQAEHLTVFVASGDCGAFTDRIYRSLSVSFPASDPWAVSVGGTILSVDGNQSRNNEVVWSNGSNPFKCGNRWGSGGGNSQLFPRPNWQKAVGSDNQFSQGHRQLPDIAAAAYALAVYFQGQWGSVGGTSAAAPIWAAGLALVNEGLKQQTQKFGYSPGLFYAVANSSNGGHPYFDVTRGNNLYYPATNGWDFSTGLGTPNLADFYQAASALMG